MQIPGPCAECRRPAVLSTCGLCAKQHCVEHRAPERHACAMGIGPEGRGRPTSGDLFTE